MEINLSEDALPWERIGFDILLKIQLSQLCRKNKIVFKKIDTIEGISSVHVEGSSRAWIR